ncbi:hypothetical protein [Halobacillus hunanensis]|uniref:hypothetical protein n=1 Tax=Halobacillus hunanensis TaxID=578214 RepID=UPI0009A71BD1|nr:hypothetical protein [Halobacillus hunanensis]
MKRVFVWLLVLLCAVTLIGFQSAKEEMTLLDNVSKISISKSEGYGGLNEKFFTSYDKKEISSRFEEILKVAKGKSSGMNNNKPDYDILVEYDNGETNGLHLILGNEGEESLFMYVGHEEDIFKVGPEATRELRLIIKTEK